MTGSVLFELKMTRFYKYITLFKMLSAFGFVDISFNVDTPTAAVARAIMMPITQAITSISEMIKLTRGHNQRNT